MARLETLVADYLTTIPAITAIVGTGTNAKVLDFDYRGAGWNTAPITILDAYGQFIRPTIVVDDAGANRPFWSRVSMAREQTIRVWVFGNRTADHADAIDTIGSILDRELHQFQEPVTGRFLTWQNRLGKVPADDGIYDYTDFRAAGIS